MSVVKSIVVILCFVVLFGDICQAEEGIALKSENDKISYSVGYQVGSDFKRQGVELNSEAMVKGVVDAMAGGEATLMSEEEMRTTLIALKRRIDAEMENAKKEETAKNLAEGKKFLEENAKKEGVHVLDSGLQYTVLKDGDGKVPQENDLVEAHYRATLIDGREFANSRKQGKPATFKVATAVPGLRQALLMMHEGSNWRLFIPEKLAFGGQENNPMADKTVIFDIELLAVKTVE